MSDNAEELEAEFGHWGEHPEFDVDSWVYAVSDGDTRLGYWAWVASELLDAEEHDERNKD